MKINLEFCSNYTAKVRVKRRLSWPNTELIIHNISRRNCKVGATKRKLNQEGKHKMQGRRNGVQSNKCILNLNYIWLNIIINVLYG